MPYGQAWQSTPAASVWVTMGEFSSTLEAVNRFKIVRKLRSQPAFQAIQQFKSLPDFLMFPVFLAFRNLPDHLTQYCFPPDMEIIHAMKAFSSVANGARVLSLSASDALKYACQNWAFHLSRVANPWGDTLDQIFMAFWNNHLLSWLERQWCLKGLRSCLVVLYEGQKLAKEHHSLESPELSILHKIASRLFIAR
ncbi:hypothetical protein DFH29DRAFT_67372 [Suillus ampliporus]|nr:hypothetical protein DFH29DRAFT_67372 [Suillus ampliporus]